jgi:hypothetical protein
MNESPGRRLKVGRCSENVLKWARERPCGSANKAGLTVTDRMTSMTRTINGTVGVSAPAAQHVGNVVFTLNSRASLHTLRLLNDPCLELTFIGP